MELELWQQLGISLGLGLLVGLQREWAVPQAAGIRSFALVTVLGSICALLALEFGGWILAGGLVAVGALMVIMNLHRGRSQGARPGPTTEIAALLMFCVGALLPIGETTAAIAIGGGVAVLLQWKKPLHAFVERIGPAELRAVFRLALIALVVLPLLPNRSFGPYAVLNPFEIWLVVVLIVGISIGSYLVSRYVGARSGSVLSGVLGGLISSTATTVSYARWAKAAPGSAPLAAMVIMIASTAVFLRVAVEVALVAPAIVWQVLPQFGVMALWMGLIAMAAVWLAPREIPETPEPKDPSNLPAAVVFGLLYALVLLLVAAAKESFGDRGLYLVAALSGLTDMDAITLSTAQLIEARRLEPETGWRMMLVGALSNILFKAGVVALLGDRRLLLRIATMFALSLVGGAVLLWAWP